MKYTLLSIEQLRKNVADDEVKGGVHQGIIWQDPRNRFLRGSLTRKEVASQFQGIKLFSESSEGESAEKQQSTSAFTLVGEENINSFLESLNNFAKTPSEKELKAFKGMFRDLALALFNLGIYATTDNIGLESISLVAAMVQFIDWDQKVHRTLSSSRGFSKGIEVLQELSSPAGVGGWASISYDSLLIQQLLNSIDAREGDLNEAREGQYHVDHPHVLFNLIPSIRESLKKLKESRQWVGTDIILDHRQEEPELHIVIRRSKDRPVFPKLSPRKKETTINEGSYVPGYGLNPIPVRN